MKRIKILHPAAKTPWERDPQRSALGRQVKMDCQRLPVPFICTGNSIHVPPRQVRGIAGGSEKFSAGVSGLVKKPIDCTFGVDREF